MERTGADRKGRPAFLAGQTIWVGAVDEQRGRPIPLINRVELERPDGTMMFKEWNRHTMRVKADQIGVWTWRMYVRENRATRLETGQFEVVPGEGKHAVRKGKSSLLNRLRRPG